VDGFASAALLGALAAGEFDCEVSDEFVSDGLGVCANANALSSNASIDRRLPFNNRYLEAARHPVYD
jgi:hypothetical protein